jgi:ADP-heptose:LPS heptosyltransferase
MKICVIKLGALGDFVLATAAFADIRAHHPNDHITLITTKKMAAFTKNIPFFDEIVWDDRKPFWNLKYLYNIRKELQGFDMVYDLQTNQRTGLYFLLAGKPNWSGIAKGCKFPHDNPNRNNMHSLERIAEQLQNSGVEIKSSTDISYAAEDASAILKEHNVPKDFIAIIPGGSKHRPGKRWPHFISLINELEKKGQQSVLIGGADEIELLQEIAKKTNAINLSGNNLNELIGILNKAKAIIGNDTGPMHIAAALHKNGITLFGPESDPKLCAPKSPNMTILHNKDFASISPQQVLDILPL